MTGAIRAVFTPYSMAIAKAIAPDGPAAFRVNSWSHCKGQSPTPNRPATSTGKPNSFAADNKVTVFEGIRLVADKMTPKANKVIAAVPALKNSRAVCTGAISCRPERLKRIAHIMVSRTGFLASRLTDMATEADLCTSRSVEITKKAKMIAASHVKIATMGTLPVSP